jgi:hypothetical protein
MALKNTRLVRQSPPVFVRVAVKIAVNLLVLVCPAPLRSPHRLAAEVTTIGIQPLRTDDRHFANMLR